VNTMNYNEQLKNKLQTNLVIATILFFLSLIYLAIKLYQIFFTNMLDIQSILILKDYVPIFLASHGLLAILSSIVIKHNFDRLYPHQQVQAFFLLGFLFFPYNLYLLYLGLQKYQEKKDYHKSLIFSILIGLGLITSLYTLSISQTKDLKPIYLNEHIIEGIYRLDQDNYVNVKVTGLARGKDLKSITYQASFTFDAPNLEEVGTEFIQISMNVKQTCIVYAFTEAQDQEEMTCTIEEFTQAGNRLYTIDDFTQFEDLYVEMGQIDLDFVISLTETGPMTITNREFIQNVYDKYQ